MAKRSQAISGLNPRRSTGRAAFESIAAHAVGPRRFGIASLRARRNFAGTALSYLRMLGELIELSQESTSAAGFESAVLGLLKREIGFDVAYFSVKGDEASPTVVALDPPIIERAVARGEIYMKELSPVKQVALAARGVAVDTEVLGLGRVRETKYFQELGAPVGIRHSLMAYLPWRGSVIAAIMLGREGAFSEREVHRVASSLPGIPRRPASRPCGLLRSGMRMFARVSSS